MFGLGLFETLIIAGTFLLFGYLFRLFIDFIRRR